MNAPGWLHRFRRKIGRTSPLLLLAIGSLLLVLLSAVGVQTQREALSVTGLVAVLVVLPLWIWVYMLRRELGDLRITIYCADLETGFVEALAPEKRGYLVGRTTLPTDNARAEQWRAVRLMRDEEQRVRLIHASPGSRQAYLGDLYGMLDEARSAGDSQLRAFLSRYA